MTQNPEPMTTTATASQATAAVPALVPAPPPRDGRDARDGRDGREYRDTREWTPQYKSVARRSLVVLGARIQPEWLSRTVSVLQVRFVGELAQVLRDLGEMAKAKKSKALPTVRLKASLALMLDGLIQVDRYLGLSQDNPRPALELYRPEGPDPADDADHSDLIDRIRSCLKVWNNDVVQSWSQANGFGDAVERLGRAISADHIAVTTMPQPLVQRSNGSRLGRPAYHLIARRLAEELVGASLFEGMSPVDLVVDPSDTSASVELLTPPVRMEGSRNMFSMAARLSVFTMPSSRDVFVKITPVKRIWSAELPGRKPNAPPNVGCTVMVPGKPFLTVRATQEKERGAVAVPAEQAPKSPWRFGEDYEEFLQRSKGMLPATLQEAVAHLAPDPTKEGWWVGFPRLTTLFDRIGGRTVFERDEFDLHETVVQMLPWALDPKLEFRRVKAVAQKAAADATHTALKPSDIGHAGAGDDGIEPGRAGQALLEDDLTDDERHEGAAGGDADTSRDVRLATGQASNVAALRALHGARPIHLFVFGGEPGEQDIIKACASVLFGQAVQVHTEALPLHTHGLKADLEKADAKSLERFEARVGRWEAAFKQLPDDGGARYVLICAERMVGRRIEDTVNYYAAIHAACRTAKANVHYVLPIQQKRGKDDVGHFVHRVQSAMLDVFLAHAGVVLGVDELVSQTIGAPPAGSTKGAEAAQPATVLSQYVVGIQVVRSRARRRSAEGDVSFILYSRLSLTSGLVQVKIACQVGKQDHATEWLDLASGLRWLGAQRAIASNEAWIREAFQNQTRGMLAKLKAEDPRAIVLIDWMRLGKIWPQLRDDQLCEVAPGSIFLGSTDLSSACPDMTFVRLRSSRDTSMTIRRLTTKLYEGWVTGPQGLEPTGEVYTERYMGPAHEIIEVVGSDAKERNKPGRWTNRHYLQVMRYRRTVQLQRGYSCYRSSERMKEIDGGEKGDGSNSKRFKIVKFEPHHEDAALPATTEVTVVTGPAAIDADQVVRLVMGLRLRYAHYPDWTALPAPLFFILKVDDYVIRYADLARAEEDEAPVAGATEDAAEALAEAGEVPVSVGGTDLIEAESGEAAPLPLNRDPYFEDVSRAIVQQLPQLQLFEAGCADPGSTTSMRVAEPIVSEPPNADATPCLDADDFDTIDESVPVIRVRGVREPGDEAAPPASAESAAVDGSNEDEEEEPEETDEERALRRPKDELLAKAWDLIQEVPALYIGGAINRRRIFEDMLRMQLRVTVDLPWYINAETIVPADAWPDHKAISRFWRMQGDRGWRLQNKPAPKTAEFKGWLMQRLRIPQSSWSVSSSQLFKGGIRIFHSVYKQYDQMLAERAAKGLEPPKVPGYAIFNSEVLARWLRDRNDDEGLGWLVAMSAHWPDATQLERLYEALDGMALGPRTRCALEYVIDCCEVVIELADMPLAKRRGLASITRKRDPRWEEEDRLRRSEEPIAKSDETVAGIDQHAMTAIAAAVSVLAAGAEAPASSPAAVIPAVAGPQDKKPAPTFDAKAPPATEHNRPETAMLRDAATQSDLVIGHSVNITLDEELLGEKIPVALQALQGVMAGMDALNPGSDGFEQALLAVQEHLQTLSQVHQHAMVERARREAAAAEAAAAAARAAADEEARRRSVEQERAARLKAVAEVFDSLRAACDSVPADLIHEALVVPGDADAWGEKAATMPADDYVAWIEKLRSQAKNIQEQAANMQDTQSALHVLDEGKDQRLAAVSGLARRQLLLTLQNQLIQSAAGANHRMATTLAEIAAMAASGAQDSPAADPTEPVTQDPSAEVQAAAVAPEAAVAPIAPVSSIAPDAVDQMTQLLERIDQGSAPAAPAAPETIPDSSPTIATPEQAVAVVHDEPAATAAEEASIAGVDVISDSAAVEENDELEDAAATPIEVDAEFDGSTLDKLIEPLQVASSERLWKLTRVGVKALCAIQSHPTVLLHASAWNSMLESLSALTTPGREQRLDGTLLAWLEAETDGPVGEGLLGFGIDVGVLGAGLMPILFEGHEARARWAVLGRVANRFHDHRPLQELCEHLQSLDSSSFTITRENLSAARVGPRKALDAEVQRQRDRAQHWADDPVLFRNWPNPEYWDMHAAMFDDRHGMHFAKAMQHVVRGADDHLRKMLPELRKYVEKTPGTLSDLRKRTGRKRPLEGPHAEKLAQNLAASVKFIEDYLVLTGRLSQVATVDTPRPQRDFLDQLYAKTQAAKEYLGQIQADLAVDPAGGLPATPASGEAHFVRLHASLARQVMEATLGLMSEEVPTPPVAEDEQVLLMDAAIDSSLEPVWSVKLEDEGTPAVFRDPLAILMEVASVQQQLVTARQARPQQKIEDLLDRAADTHRQRGEILAARAIEQRMRNASPQVLSQMQSANETAHRKLRSALSEELSDARQRVTNALSVGPMTQAEASRMLKVIETLDRANREGRIGAIVSTPAPFEDYPQSRALLHNHIIDPLQQRIHESLRALKDDISAFREKLDKMGLDESDRARKVEQLDRIVAGLKEVTPTNIRVARHSFSLLEQDQLPMFRLNTQNPAQAYEAFQRDLSHFTTNRSPLESLRDALCGKDEGKHWPKGQKPAWAANLTDEQAAEAADFLDAWVELTEARTLNDIHDPLARFFKAAGTVDSPTAMSEPGNNSRTAFHMPAKTFVGSARLQNFWVPPVLGSAARDLRGVVLKHRPAPELVAQVIDELPMTTPNFVLGRTRLNLARRSAVSRDHPVILVDDDLVAYMAVHPEYRLAKMMEVGLLTFRDNPYDDYGGPVPTEMFFGRRSELMRLAGNKSAMVLYGGRRLGKSSLLDRIQMESRQSLVKVGGETRGEVAIYIPLESRIDSAVFGDDHKLFAWMGIYRATVANGFIKPAKTEPKTADSIFQHIRGEIMAGNALTNACYLLIDEADEVMGRDIESSGAFASSLRALCDDVRDVCTIRYVIAGLHNLTRLHTEGNTALAKADAIALQPFSSGQDILMGVDLITKPLAALGFVFQKGSEELPMRILAMCNFYPAFVQLYCKNLIQDLYNKRGTKAPTTPIEASDLDKVERNKDFIGVMQEKFRYNLDLDKRYKGIALVLADTYYHGSGAGVEQGLTASDLRGICDDYFPNYFSKTGEGAFPALLEEMEKLTVIDRKGGRYQLRTPHIATMMGSKEDVEHKIEELRRETAPANRIPGETRPLLTRGNVNDWVVFPMSSGWVRQLLHEEERDLVILVGNHLSGLVDIENIKYPFLLGRDAQYEIKFFSNIDNARPYLNAMRRASETERPNRIVAVPSRAWQCTKTQIDEFAAFARNLARPLIGLPAEQRQRATNVRLMLVANPQQAWELAKMVNVEAPGMVEGVPNGSFKHAKLSWRVEAVPAWNDDAVYYRLKQLENQTLPDHPEVCAEVLEATMGFGGELAKMLRASTRREGVSEAKNEIRRRVAASRETFYAAIGWSQAIDPQQTRAAEVLLSLLDGEKRSEEVIVGWAKDCNVSQAMVTYMRWMGLLQDGDGGTWRVPALYKALIAPATPAAEGGENKAA